ncbi:MAG: hypothetical protein LBD64_07510 [Odoribacteraceae bacterium]|jgi:hypothetical protein|nr:hypothetical protein [Odoribacteraceae bacterium]
MKAVFISILAVALLVSCIEDKGNYRYAEPEEPLVTMDSVYAVTIGERLVIQPGVEFSSKSRLSFHWEISDPVLMTAHAYESDALDILFTLRAQRYMARLTVTDNGNGMKYFYPFLIEGRSAFSEGVLVLSSDDGQARLAFIGPDNEAREVYERMNNGETLPRDPLQIIALYNPNLLGGLYTGYWITCADGDNPGVLVDPATLVKVRGFKENFFDIPDAPVLPGHLIPLDNGTMAGVINGKFYVGRFEGYHEWPGFGYFSPPINGGYTLAPFSVTTDGTFHWCYDVARRALVCFIPPAGMMFEVQHIQGPPVQWDPANVDLDFITLLSGPTGCYLFGRDNDGVVHELAFQPAGQSTISMYRRPFLPADLLSPATLWAIYLTEIYFSSGDKLYRYNPNSQRVDLLPGATVDGEITLLKVGRDANRLVVGTRGHLYWIDVSPGQEGRVVHDVDGIDGYPVDLYEKR